MNNQKLKAHCEDVIANPQDHLDWVVDMARVALASLEAVPVHQVKIGDSWQDQSEHDAKILGENWFKIRKVYTAPPVPELKLPDNLQEAFEVDSPMPSQTSRCGSGYCSHSFNNWDGQAFMHQFDGFVKAVSYIKILNGVKS